MSRMRKIGHAVAIGGKKADRGGIKVGMTCKITYEGDDSFAKTIACP